MHRSPWHSRTVALPPSLVEAWTSAGRSSPHDGFKDMIREGMPSIAGELAIVTYFQAKAYGKPFVMLPIPVSGRTQHHCIGFNKELGHFDPKDIEGKKVGVRTYAQTTGLVGQREFSSTSTWCRPRQGHLDDDR